MVFNFRYRHKAAPLVRCFLCGVRYLVGIGRHGTGVATELAATSDAALSLIIMYRDLFGPAEHKFRLSQPSSK